MADSPGALTSVAQILSSLHLHVQCLTFESDGNGRAAIAILLVAEERTIELLGRKFSKLIDVVTVEAARGDGTSA